MKQMKNFLKRKNIVFSAQRYGIDALGAVALSPTGLDWPGLALVAIVLPAILTPMINMACRRLGWVKDGDLKLQ